MVREKSNPVYIPTPDVSKVDVNIFRQFTPSSSCLALRPSFGRWHHRSYSTNLSFTLRFPTLSLVFRYSE
jgi:hypothetical protein